MTRPVTRTRAILLLVVLAVLDLTWLTGPARAQDPPTTEPPVEESTTTTTTAPPPATPMITTAAPGTATGTAAATTRPLELRGQTPFVAPSDTFSIKLAVHDAPAGARIGFTLWNPITSPKWRVDQRRDRLDQWVTNPGTTDDVFASKFAGGFPLSLFDRAADGTITANFPIVPASQPNTATGFQIDDAGVYPLTVSLLAPDADKPVDSFTTFLIRLPTDKTPAPPLQVATLVNFHAPVATKPDGTTLIPADDRARLQATIDLLDRHPDIPLTLDPTPETVAGLVPTDPREASAAAETPVDRLARAIAGREVLSSTFVDVDIDAWVASEMGAHLDRQLTLGFDTLNTHLHPTPSADRHTWKTREALSGASLARLRELGVEQMILPDTLVQPLDAKAFTPVQQQIVHAQPFDIENQAGGKVRAGASDHRLAGRLTASTNPALAAQITLADLAILYYSSADNPNNLPATTRGIVLDVPEDLAALGAFDAVLGALATAPVPTGGARATFAPVTLDSYFRIPPAVVAKSTSPLVRSTVAPSNRRSMGSYPTQLTEAEGAAAAYRSMVGRTAPDRVTANQRLLDVSGAEGFDDARRRSYLDTVRTTVSNAAGAIVAPEQTQITFTDFEGDLKVQLENGLPYPVDVLVVLGNKQLVFDEMPNEVAIVSTLQPGDNRLPVKVRTRTSCVCAVDVSIFSADHALPLASTRYRVRFTVISGLGLVLTISAGFFLLLWWGKNWRKTVRARKLVAIDAGGPAGAPATDPADDQPAVPARAT